MNAAQLIIDNRAVVIEYARDKGDRSRDGGEGGGRPRFDDRSGRPPRSDWLCAVVMKTLLSIFMNHTYSN